MARTKFRTIQIDPNSEAWGSWTPTFTNFTTGNGTLNYAKYIQLGKTVHFRLKMTLGSTSAVTGGITFSLPVNVHSDLTAAQDTLLCWGYARNTTLPVTYDLQAAWASSSSIILVAMNIGTTYLTNTTTSSTVPFTWATGHFFTVAGTYEAA
jgi:hypothetical protein